MITPAHAGQLVTKIVLVTLGFYALVRFASWVGAKLHNLAIKYPAAHVNEATGLDNDSEN